MKYKIVKHYNKENGHFTVPEDDEAQNIAATDEINTLDNAEQSPTNQRKAVRVTIFYDDGSFQDL